MPQAAADTSVVRPRKWNGVTPFQASRLRFFDRLANRTPPEKSAATKHSDLLNEPGVETEATFDPADSPLR